MIKSDYSYITKKYGEDIDQRIALLVKEYDNFSKATKIKEGSLSLPIQLLFETVLNYFVDIDRIKPFHGIDKINKIKIAAYQAYWWVKIKPIQIINYPDIDSWRYLRINEYFALHNATSILFDKSVRLVFSDPEILPRISEFHDFMLYCLTYRNLTAQAIELAFMGLTTTPIHEITSLNSVNL